MEEGERRNTSKEKRKRNKKYPYKKRKWLRWLTFKNYYRMTAVWTLVYAICFGVSQLLNISFTNLTGWTLIFLGLLLGAAKILGIEVRSFSS